ncbi:MAG TPA: response regulator transcription factor [Caldimonas sp.]|jgi:DNA-binding response OmpR family regulator
MSAARHEVPAAKGSSGSSPRASARVLIAEDDHGIASNLLRFLELKGFDVEAVYSGHAVLHRCGSEAFDVVLLDLGFPGLDGLTVLQRLRAELRSSVPVLVVSARSSLEDKLASFAHGADDYLVKPFALSELEARVRALLKRAAGTAVVDAILRFESIEFDTSSREAYVGGRLLRLTPKGATLLELLLRTPGRLVRREAVEQAVWPEGPPQADALRSQIHGLRRALAGHGFDGLETVHGVGYRLVGARRVE